MTIEQARKEIISVIAESTETELELAEQVLLVQDMGLSSMEFVVLIGDLETEFGISIPVSRMRSVQTVGDLCDVVIGVLSE